LLDATQHDRYAAEDFKRLQSQGIYTARSGIRWHRIETRPGWYDFSHELPMIRAARETGTQVIWDLLHYGWPDDLDLFSPEFRRRFTRMVKAFVRLLRDEIDTVPFFTPVNEISFFSWAAGDAGYLNPFCNWRGYELKVQMAWTAIEAAETIWSVTPNARLCYCEPAINIAPHPHKPQDTHDAEGQRLAQYQAYDLVAGRLWPQIGGQEKYLDVIGINFYPNNQWVHGSGMPISWRSPGLYKPFREILAEVYAFYKRPMFIAETGAEAEMRVPWLRYVCEETLAAMQMGIPIEGLCIYPILDYPGWDDDRHCPAGLWDYCDETGERELYAPLAAELQRQRILFDAERAEAKAS
jgi:beta-glucosidase/6-phospho-beta-glucosidase/beta-galactosidase